MTKMVVFFFTRNEIGVKASKEVHSSGQGGPTWRPTQ